MENCLNIKQRETGCEPGGSSSACPSADASDEGISSLRLDEYITLYSDAMVRPPLPVPLPVPLPAPFPLPVPGDCRFDRSCYPPRPTEPPPIDVDPEVENASRPEVPDEAESHVNRESYATKGAEFPPACSFMQSHSIDHGSGQKSTITFGLDAAKNSIDEFISADGVKYKRVELGWQEMEILESKLGRKVPDGFSAWVVEGGGINKSNGNSDRKIIANVDFDCKSETVKVNTIWPVPQETVYYADSSFEHKFSGGARTITRSGDCGVQSVRQDWPGSSFERETVTGLDGRQHIYDRDKKTGKVSEQTYKYQLW